MNILSFVKTLVSILLMTTLIGCSANGSNSFQPSLNLSINLLADENINLFDDDQPRPVIVHIYQLNDIGNFDKADYTMLFNNYQSILSTSLVDSITLPAVLPNEQRSFTLDVQQKARYLAVFAEFSSYETAKAKSSVAMVEDPESYPINIRITNNQIEITQPMSDPWWKF